MTEKRLTEARRLAKKILPKIQKMQRDMYFNNHVCVSIDFYSIGYNFYVTVNHVNDKNDRSEKPSFKMFFFFTNFTMQRRTTKRSSVLRIT